MGTTLPAMNGTVSLVKVISPANVVYGWPFTAGPGHVLVAVVLTVHSSATGSAPFQRIYSQSKLVDSTGKAHPAKATARFKVTDCVSYPAFAQLSAGQSSTGCEVFQIAAGAEPTELKVAGPQPADWQIAKSAIAESALPVVPLALPHTSALAPKKSTTVPLATSGSGSTSTTTSVAGAGGATTTTTGGKSGPHAHHPGAPSKHTAPKIQRFEPVSASVGSGVVIVGKKLDAATVVSINGIPARIIKDKPGRLQFVVPDGATTGPVSVTTPGGTTVSVKTLSIF